jgi:hypothetical protein
MAKSLSLLINIQTEVPQVSLHARTDITINDSSTNTYLKTALKKEMYLNFDEIETNSIINQR